MDLEDKVEKNLPENRIMRQRQRNYKRKTIIGLQDKSRRQVLQPANQDCRKIKTRKRRKLPIK